MSYELIDALSEVGMRMVNHHVAKADGHTPVHTYIMIPSYVKFVDGVLTRIREFIASQLHAAPAELMAPDWFEGRNVKHFTLCDETDTAIIIQCDHKDEVASVTVQYREL